MKKAKSASKKAGAGKPFGGKQAKPFGSSGKNASAGMKGMGKGKGKMC